MGLSSENRQHLQQANKASDAFDKVATSEAEAKGESKGNFDTAGMQKADLSDLILGWVAIWHDIIKYEGLKEYCNPIPLDFGQTTDANETLLKKAKNLLLGSANGYVQEFKYYTNAANRNISIINQFLRDMHLSDGKEIKNKKSAVDNTVEFIVKTFRFALSKVDQHLSLDIDEQIRTNKIIIKAIVQTRDRTEGSKWGKGAWPLISKNLEGPFDLLLSRLKRNMEREIRVLEWQNQAKKFKKSVETFEVEYGKKYIPTFKLILLRAMFPDITNITDSLLVDIEDLFLQKNFVPLNKCANHHEYIDLNYTRFKDSYFVPQYVKDIIHCKERFEILLTHFLHPDTSVIYEEMNRECIGYLMSDTYKQNVGMIESDEQYHLAADEDTQLVPMQSSALSERKDDNHLIGAADPQTEKHVAAYEQSIEKSLNIFKLIKCLTKAMQNSLGDECKKDLKLFEDAAERESDKDAKEPNKDYEILAVERLIQLATHPKSPEIAKHTANYILTIRAGLRNIHHMVTSHKGFQSLVELTDQTGQLASRWRMVPILKDRCHALIRDGVSIVRKFSEYSDMIQYIPELRKNNAYQYNHQMNGTSINSLEDISRTCYLVGLDELEKHLTPDAMVQSGVRTQAAIGGLLTSVTLITGGKYQHTAEPQQSFLQNLAFTDLVRATNTKTIQQQARLMIEDQDHFARTMQQSFNNTSGTLMLPPGTEADALSIGTLTMPDLLRAFLTFHGITIESILSGRLIEKDPEKGVYLLEVLTHENKKRKFNINKDVKSFVEIYKNQHELLTRATSESEIKDDFDKKLIQKNNLNIKLLEDRHTNNADWMRKFDPKSTWTYKINNLSLPWKIALFCSCIGIIVLGYAAIYREVNDSAFITDQLTYDKYEKENNTLIPQQIDALRKENIMIQGGLDLRREQKIEQKNGISAQAASKANNIRRNSASKEEFGGKGTQLPKFHDDLPPHPMRASSGGGPAVAPSSHSTILNSIRSVTPPPTLHIEPSNINKVVVMPDEKNEEKKADAPPQGKIITAEAILNELPDGSKLAIWNERSAFKSDSSVVNNALNKERMNLTATIKILVSVYKYDDYTGDTDALFKEVIKLIQSNPIKPVSAAHASGIGMRK